MKIEDFADKPREFILEDFPWMSSSIGHRTEPERTPPKIALPSKQRVGGKLPPL